MRVYFPLTGSNELILYPCRALNYPSPNRYFFDSPSSLEHHFSNIKLNIVAYLLMDLDFKERSFDEDGKVHWPEAFLTMPSFSIERRMGALHPEKPEIALLSR
jgi:hypothetical protein